MNVISILANNLKVLAVLLTCLLTLTSCSIRELPPAGVELSTIEGVSIVRVTNRGGSGYEGAMDGSTLQFEADNMELSVFLALIAAEDYPIVMLSELPEGEYNISARAESGEIEALIDLVCLAFSEAFDCTASKREIELEAVVITCKNRETLLLKEVKKRELSHGTATNAGRSFNFTTLTMDELAFFAGYYSRKSLGWPEISNREVQLLQQVFLNETEIEGYFSGELDYDPEDPSVLKKALRKVGITITEEPRTVTAVIVESNPSESE